jgi:hypothetical protein
MSKGDTFENDFLKLILQGTPIANVADNAATSPLSSLYLALHTADPGEAGSQTTNEAAYTGYARKAVARTSGGFTIVANVASLAADQDFGECTVSPGSNLTHWSIGTAPSGAGKILWKGALGSAIAMAIGVIPRVKAGTVITED